jgi:hypothetical protein
MVSKTTRPFASDRWAPRTRASAPARRAARPAIRGATVARVGVHDGEAQGERDARPALGDRAAHERAVDAPRGA